MAKKAKAAALKARGKKKAAATTTAKTTAKSASVMKTISEKDFAALNRAVKGHESDKNSAVGSMGTTIANAVDKKHLHKDAYSLYRRLEKKSDNKLAECLAHFDHYREIGGLDERAAKQQQMFERPEAGEVAVDDAGHFDSQREREAHGDFEPGELEGAAVH